MPRRTNHEERREEIAEAAWRTIEARGPEGAGMREIAREAGYTTGVLTHYFRDKRELMAFAFGLLVERSTERVARRAGEGELLGALGELLPLDAERRQECTVWLALMDASLRDPQLARELRQRYGEARRAMAPVFREAFGGMAGAEDPEDLGDELLAAIDGLTVAALTDPERYPPERQVGLLRQAFVRLGLPL